MSLKKIAMFNVFNAKEFFLKKKLLFTGHDVLFDENKNEIGLKYKILIVEDETNYGKDKNNGEDLIGLNEGELLVVKVHGNTNSVDIKRLAHVKLVNPIAKIYGEYSNNLSLVADNVITVESKS